jgi:DNA-binding XRE family transcriptional regulator
MTVASFSRGFGTIGENSQLEGFHLWGNLLDSTDYPPSPWLFLPSSSGAPARPLHDFSSWVTLPSALPSTRSTLPQLIRQIREWTGWSQREMATLLQISHTTVRKLESDGRVTARSRAAATRVAPIHDLVRRAAVVAGFDQQRLATALSTSDERGRRPTDLIAGGHYSLAYVAALRALRGARTAMLAPTGDRAILDATVELH